MYFERVNAGLLVFAMLIPTACANTEGEEDKTHVALDACFDYQLDGMAAFATHNPRWSANKEVNAFQETRLKITQLPHWKSDIAPAIRKACECYMGPIVADLVRHNSSSELKRKVRRMDPYAGPVEERARYEACVHSLDGILRSPSGS